MMLHIICHVAFNIAALLYIYIYIYISVDHRNTLLFCRTRWRLPAESLPQSSGWRFFYFVERDGACQRNRCHSHPVDVSFILSNEKALASGIAASVIRLTSLLFLSNEKALVGGFAAVVFRLTFYFAMLGLWYMQVDMLIYCWYYHVVTLWYFVNVDVCNQTKWLRR